MERPTDRAEESISYFVSEATIARQNAGRSSGNRDVMKLPSTTHSWSTQFAPALMQSFLKKHRDYDAGMMHVEEFHLYQSTLTPAGPIHRRELTIAAR